MDNRFSEPYSHPRWWFAGGYLPWCFSCKRFRGAAKGKVRCLTYEDTIPIDIALLDERKDKPPPCHEKQVND